MPAMQVKFGAYDFTAGACRFAVRTFAELDARKLPFMYANEIEVMGRLYGDGDSNLSNQERQLRLALGRTGQDFGVLQTDGQRSATWWPNAQTVGGNVVVEGPNFGGTTAAEYCLYREFTFTVRNRVPVADITNAILEFSETVEYEGGEPEYAMKRAINAPPQKQLVWFQTEYRVTQSGRAVGYKSYPPVGRILFPGDKDKAGKYTRESPEREGDDYVRYPVSWSFTYASASPLVAFPNRWVG